MDQYKLLILMVIRDGGCGASILEYSGFRLNVQYIYSVYIYRSNVCPPSFGFAVHVTLPFFQFVWHDKNVNDSSQDPQNVITQKQHTKATSVCSISSSFIPC